MINIFQNEVHLWLIPFNSLFINEKYLTNDEFNKINSFKFKVHKVRSKVYYSALRHILAVYHDKIEPQNIIITKNKYGKPYLLQNKLELYFNLSHSNNLAILAIAKNHPVGVDIEQIIQFENLEPIVKRFFTKNEYKNFISLPKNKRLVAFYEIWTRKEAYIKAIGKGLSFPLDNFTVSFYKNFPPRIISIKSSKNEAKSWFMYTEKYQFYKYKYEIACTVRNTIKKVLKFNYSHLYNRQYII